MEPIIARHKYETRLLPHIIWTDLNHSLLYIASVNSNSIESIDIRVNNLKHWTVVYGDSKQRKLQDLFGTAFVDYSIQTCRLLK